MKRFILITFCLISLNVFAQEKEEKPYIEINTEAERKVTPDEIYIYVNIEERFDGKDKITIEEQEKKFKKALKDKGIDLNELKLLDAMSEYQKVKWHGKKDAIASTEYSLMVTTGNEVKIVFEILADLQIEKSSIYKTEYSKEEELKKELRIEAMKKAKDQADYMLEAIGQKTGKAMIVRENNNYNQRPVTWDLNPTYYDAGMDYKSFESSNNSIQFNDLAFQIRVYIKFEIAQ